MLVHINPLMIENTSIQAGLSIRLIVSDTISKKLMEKPKVEMLAGVAAMFISEAASSLLH